MIRERVKAGLDRARAQGKRLGRPSIDARKETAIRNALKNGDAGIRKIATRLGVGTGTVQKIKAELSAGSNFSDQPQNTVRGEVHEAKDGVHDGPDTIRALRNVTNVIMARGLKPNRPRTGETSLHRTGL
jgi:hypothetical protein